jgi:hypothetical protein
MNKNENNIDDIDMHMNQFLNTCVFFLRLTLLF